MTKQTELAPGVVRLTDGLGLVPKRSEIDALMKRCQIGVGGRNALDNAHSIMADCYGTLGALMLEIERLRLTERHRVATIVRNAASAHGLCCADCVALAEIIEDLGA